MFVIGIFGFYCYFVSMGYRMHMMAARYITTREQRVSNVYNNNYIW
jgi:hypothetical protein